MPSYAERIRAIINRRTLTRGQNATSESVLIEIRRYPDGHYAFAHPDDAPLNGLFGKKAASIIVQLARLIDRWDQTAPLVRTAPPPYRITFFRLGVNGQIGRVVEVATFDEALATIAHAGPPGWQRYSIEQGGRHVERGDPAGVRGALAPERQDPRAATIILPEEP